MMLFRCNTDGLNVGVDVDVRTEIEGACSTP